MDDSVKTILWLDGFASAGADDRGEIVSRRIRFADGRLELEMDASAGGVVEVEILDLLGAPNPGFTLAEAERLEGNSVRRVASWRGRRDGAALAGRSLRLRWRMRDAKLSAFQFLP
jgi:hypothetical protein